MFHYRNMKVFLIELEIILLCLKNTVCELRALKKLCFKFVGNSFLIYSQIYMF